MRPLTDSDVRRFRKYVRPGQGDACWLWSGAITCGYGVFGMTRAGQHLQYRAHRIAYFIATGRCPGDLDVCHHCDNPPCVRPDHLFVGSRRDNMQDCVRKRRNSYGARRPDAKLTEATVRQIRRARIRGVKLTALAERYGVCVQIVSRAARADTWAHVA